MHKLDHLGADCEAIVVTLVKLDPYVLAFSSVEAFLPYYQHGETHPSFLYTSWF